MKLRLFCLRSFVKLMSLFLTNKEQIHFDAWESQFQKLFDSSWIWVTCKQQNFTSVHTKNFPRRRFNYKAKLCLFSSICGLSAGSYRCCLFSFFLQSTPLKLQVAMVIGNSMTFLCLLFLKEKRMTSFLENNWWLQENQRIKFHSFKCWI